MKKNGFLTFCFSFIPGAGEMYVGYMKRGLSLIILLACVIALCMFVGSPIFAIPIPVIFIYCFFDTWNLRNLDQESRNNLPDDYVWKDFNLETTFGKKLFEKRNLILGAILLIVGIYILSDTVFLNLSYMFNVLWLQILMDTMTRYIPTIVVAVLAMYFGYKLIVGKKEDK